MARLMKESEGSDLVEEAAGLVPPLYCVPRVHRLRDMDTNGHDGETKRGTRAAGRRTEAGEGGGGIDLVAYVVVADAVRALLGHGRPAHEPVIPRQRLHLTAKKNGKHRRERRWRGVVHTHARHKIRRSCVDGQSGLAWQGRAGQDLAQAGCAYLPVERGSEGAGAPVHVR